MNKVLIIVLVISLITLISVYGSGCVKEPASGTIVEETGTGEKAIEETTTDEIITYETDDEITKAQESEDDYVPQSVDDLMWKNISNFLTQFYLADNIPNMTEEDKKFQFYMIDLNEDGQDEYFVLLPSAYFCSTDGCTRLLPMLLLDRYSEVITKFTLIEPPFYVSQDKTNGWRDLLVYSEGSYRDLIFDGKTYPSNPNLELKSSKRPDDTYEVLFDDKNFPAKTYYFYEPGD